MEDEKRVELNDNDYRFIRKNVREMARDLIAPAPRRRFAKLDPEVCFGQRDGAIWLTRMCLPKAVRKGAQRSRRFGMGDRVSCAVEDATGDYSDWAAGIVVAVDFPVESCDGVEGGMAPYSVVLDSGSS